MSALEEEGCLLVPSLRESSIMYHLCTMCLLCLPMSRHPRKEDESSVDGSPKINASKYEPLSYEPSILEGKVGFQKNKNKKIE